MQRIQNDPQCGDGSFVVAIQRAGESYFIFYDDDHVADAFQQLGRWASSPALSFDWEDACKLSQKIRENAEASV